MRELGLTNQVIVFLGDVRVRQEDELGRGSDALVYRLNWQGIDIALKVLHPILSLVFRTKRGKSVLSAKRYSVSVAYTIRTCANCWALPELGETLLLRWGY